MEDVNISKFRAQVVRSGSTPASPGFVVSEGQNPVDPSGSGQNHLPVTIGSPANGLAVTDSQILTIDKAQIFAGTSSQFVKGDGTLDSTAYGTGSVTSVALTMPAAFSVANSPVTTAGTLAVTATGTTAQYIRGDGTLETFPALTGFVPYTGATADVNLGTFDLLAERGTFENNGSSNTLTVNHTSGSGYGIIVTKGGNNEALYVSKTSGSGNAMTVVGGRTSLVDLALSSVTNTAGDFLTLSGGVVHKRTAAQTLTDIGGQAALTNPVTGTGTTNYLPKFTGSTTIGNSQVVDDGTNVGINTASPEGKLTVVGTSAQPPTSGTTANSLLQLKGSLGNELNIGSNTVAGNYGAYIQASDNNLAVPYQLNLQPNGGNVIIGGYTDAGFKLDVNGTGRFSGNLRIEKATPLLVLNDTSGAGAQIGSFGGNLNLIDNATGTKGVVINLSTGAATFSSLGTGTVTATAGVLSTVSDLNYKIDDGFIDSAIEKVIKLKPRYFYWNEKSGLPKEIRQLGFYAQEINEALGEEAANTPQDKNTPWGISDRSIIAMLTKAIQELKQEIDTLKN
jgi:hypothetical protein